MILTNNYLLVFLLVSHLRLVVADMTAKSAFLCGLLWDYVVSVVTSGCYLDSRLVSTYSPECVCSLFTVNVYFLHLLSSYLGRVDIFRFFTLLTRSWDLVSSSRVSEEAVRSARVNMYDSDGTGKVSLSLCNRRWV